MVPANQAALKRPMNRRYRDFIKKIKRDKYLLLMLILPMAFYVIFRYGPMYGLVMAFQNFKASEGIMGSTFVGFEQFRRFMGDSLFWKAFWNTIILNLINIAVCFPAPIILALLLNELRNQKFRKLVQSISYIPYFISTVVVCSIVTTFCSNQGIINNFLELLGLGRINFLLEPRWFRTIYVVSELWQTIGWNSIINILPHSFY